MATSPSFQTLKVAKDDDGVLVVCFNRPNRKNAFNKLQYDEFVAALDQAKRDDTVRCVVITGNGDYYSSGNDLSMFMQIDLNDKASLEKELREAQALLNRFVNSFIYFPKILVAAVNGPAIGVAATTLQHCDFIYGSESCTFNTPFVPLAQTPEACSSYLLPRIMGPRKANEMLLLGKKFSAREALTFGLLNDVFPDDKLMPQVMNIAKQIARSPAQALLESKKLIRNSNVLAQLEEVARNETAVLAERWASEEFMQTIFSFFSKKTQSRL